MPSQPYTNLYNSILLYVTAYGGIKDVIRSPYLHLSFIISLIVTSTSQAGYWYDIPLQILPNLLGFTLAGYAVIITFGSKEFWEIVCKKEKGEENSLFIQISATFAHFIIVQIIALLTTIISKYTASTGSIISTVGTTLFFYSILLAFAATLSILNISNCFDKLNE